MKKVSIVCWNCGQPSLIPDDSIGHGWLSCTRCGATDYPDPVELGPAIITIEKIDHGRETKYRPVKKRGKHMAVSSPLNNPLSIREEEE